MSLDPAVRDLLETISRAVDGASDWRAVAVGSAVDRVLAGDDDPGAAADWLRGFLAERERAAKTEVAEPAHAVWGYDWVPEPPEGTTT